VRRLADLLSLVEAQNGKKLTSSQAAALTTSAEAIASTLDC
jgi:hypothetical protein